MTFLPLTSNSNFPTDQTFRQFHELNTELDLLRITSGFYGALQRVWHADRECLPFRTPGSVPRFFFGGGGLLMLQLLRPDFQNLQCLYSTFHLCDIVSTLTMSPYDKLLRRNMNILYILKRHACITKGLYWTIIYCIHCLFHLVSLISNSHLV